MAGKELFKVRVALVEKISGPVLKDLLDDLLEDEILNDGEKESLLEEYNARKDRARALIDMVRKKGDNASRKMLDHLMTRDKNLIPILSVSTDAPAADAFPGLTKPVLPPSVNCLNTLTLTDNDFYPVKATSRLALIITNRDFTDPSMSRRGAEKDEQNMEMLLKDLGYTVVKHNNLTGPGIGAAVKKFSEDPRLSETDSVFVVISSHGKLGKILGINWTVDKPDEFRIDDIYQYLSTQKCPALLNKPKVIIIQACRGESGGAVPVMCTDGPGDNDDHVDDVKPDAWCEPDPLPSDGIEEDALRMAHKEKDFISLLSSTPDCVSYRLPTEGSFLIQYINQVFRACGKQDHIEELFRKVMKCFVDFPDPRKRQMPTKDRCTLTKLFYLAPPH